MSNSKSNNLEEGDQNLQSVSGGGDAANLPLLPENQEDESHPWESRWNPDIKGFDVAET